MNTTGKPGSAKISSVTATVGAVIAAILVFGGGAAVAQTSTTSAPTTTPATTAPAVAKADVGPPATAAQ
ncbi:MAG: hypothetical protein M3326_06685, partial [Actinomycetota bacterium]|nr:hypothetical protein [Actinomycetota bacterium]